MQRLTKQVLNVIVLGLIGLMIAGLAYIHSSQAQLFSVQSGSMSPALSKGDLTVVHSVPSKQLSAGDIITFASPDNPRVSITHRIVKTPSQTKSGLFVTKGDANSVADTPIAGSSIVGRVDAQLPAVGHAIDFIRNPIGLLLIIYVPALLVVIDELRRLHTHFKRRDIYFTLPGLGKKFRHRSTKVKTIGFLKSLGFCVVAGTLIVLPTQSAFSSSVVLQANTISTSSAANQPTDILLRVIRFQCSPDNTAAQSRLVEVLLFNRSSADISAAGWYIESSAGRVATFGQNTSFDARDNYDIEPDLAAAQGVNYSGDYLALFDQNGQVVDAVSWGTDTSYLNPNLPGALEGDEFRRLNIETNSGDGDWAVTARGCS